MQLRVLIMELATSQRQAVDDSRLLDTFVTCTDGLLCGQEPRRDGQEPGECGQDSTRDRAPRRARHRARVRTDARCVSDSQCTASVEDSGDEIGTTGGHAVSLDPAGPRLVEMRHGGRLAPCQITELPTGHCTCRSVRSPPPHHFLQGVVMSPRGQPVLSAPETAELLGISRSLVQQAVRAAPCRAYGSAGAS